LQQQANHFKSGIRRKNRPQIIYLHFIILTKMLQVHFIRENKQKVLEGLAKRNFADAETIVDQVLTADENRRKTQVSLDEALAESNKLSKEIGAFFKMGEIQKAGLL
jgi:seryl-tRNA synthetase